jgi:hypothetical protein
MNRAEALLLETDYSAQEIAGCLGYQEVNRLVSEEVVEIPRVFAV